MCIQNKIPNKTKKIYHLNATRVRNVGFFLVKSLNYFAPLNKLYYDGSIYIQMNIQKNKHNDFVTNKAK